ncbi:DUF1513 domain-containing protein [Pseudorhodobacter sp.]|uniref:DUF1513 domain-containing protein n=1 Tax=Pseudorhodobacter sp. TaxID=1934400 RepID=UPI002649D10E|nr:DUF1513 domain-containing protein [Pseudorhodobacter sp.]MDN5788955.1 DUF1513 domain-containing protein [Pseudorhodobacter sp.]
MATRRGFLGGLLASGTLPTLSWADVGNPAFLAAAKEPDGGYVLVGLSASGEDRFRIPLPARGHAATAHPTRPEAVAFARRPGTYALVLDCISGAVLGQLRAPDGNTFNGHGAFSQSGDILYTSEVVAATGAGRIGLWSRANGYARTGDIASGGIGPHEIRRLPGVETLVVANGGIRTGANDRDMLNLGTMAPNLAYLAPSGQILNRISLAPQAHHASIRHLSVGPEGGVAFAMQWQGESAAAPALLGLHRMGRAAPLLAMAPSADHMRMQGYAGSVTHFDGGKSIAISSPKGGLVQVFDAKGAFQYQLERPDVCGLAASGAALTMTDGFGTFLALEGGKPTHHARSKRAWDNHLVAL